MTQATHIESVESRAMRTPVDRLIVRVARKVSQSKAKEIERFLKFAMVGTLGAIIDLGTSYILLSTFFDPRIRMEYLTAATISFLAAVMSNFFWNRYWTYPDSRSRSFRRQFALFVLVSLTGWVGRTIWLNLAKPVFETVAMDISHHYNSPLNDVDAALIGGMIAILLGIFVVMIWNFFVNRYWTYNDVD
jgi:putative flippase GtrA